MPIDRLDVLIIDNENMATSKILTGISILTAGCTRDAQSACITGSWLFTWDGCHLAHSLSRSRPSEHFFAREKNAADLKASRNINHVCLLLFIANTPTQSEACYNIISGNLFISNQIYQDIFRPIASGVASACFYSQKDWARWR